MMKLRIDIDTRDQELAQRDQNLKHAEQNRRTSSQGFAAVKRKLTESQSRITKLTKERDDLESNLKLREFEFQILQQSASQHIELHQQSILLREKEIAHLKKQLQAVVQELDEAKSQISALRERLQETSLELAEKSARVQLLREAKEEMKLLLEMERKRLDNYLMQQTAANTSHDSYRQEVEVYISGELCDVWSTG